MRTTSVLALLLLALGGCAHAPSPGSPMPPPTGAASGPPALPDASTPAQPAPSPMPTVAGSRGRAVHWRLAGTSDGGRLLLLDASVGGPPCDLVTAIDVAESATAVRITVYAGVPSGASCGPPRAMLGVERVSAHLSRPLAGREVR